MKILSNLGITWYSFRYKRRLNRLLKVRHKYSYAIFIRSYIQANSLFPNATLDGNFKLAVLVLQGFLDASPDTKIKKVKNERVERLRENLRSNESVTDTLLNYFLLESFYFDFGNDDGRNRNDKERADEAFDKARSLKDTVVRISIQDVKSINKKIKKELKMLKKISAKVESKKFEDEKLKIKIKKSEAVKAPNVKETTVVLFGSLVYGFFLVVGIFQIKILMWFLDVNTSDFFDISDYLSSSVDLISSVAFSVVIGMIFYFEGVLRILDNEIATKQFNVKIKNRRPRRKVAAIISIIIFFVHAFYIEAFSAYILLPSVFWLWDYIMFRLIKTGKRIENRLAFYAAVFSVFIFIAYLGIEMFNTLYEVKTDSYQSPYIVSFQEEYKEYSDHAFFLANSNYVFLLDKETKEVVAIPKTGIKAIQVKKDDVSFFRNLKVVYQWLLQKFLQMLSNLQQSIAEIIASKSILNLFVSK